MTKDFFERVYETTGKTEIAAVYDEWASVYDDDIAKAGYATPNRVASALSSLLPDPDTAILDYGCGTGLSGVALGSVGFRNITGCDPSPGMLAKGADLGVYKDTFAFDPLTPPGAKELGAFPAIVACGVVSVGAAPPDVLDHLFSNLARGARLALSYNSHTLEDPAYMAALEKVTASSDCDTEFSEDGPHLPKLGLISRVMVLRRT